MLTALSPSKGMVEGRQAQGYGGQATNGARPNHPKGAEHGEIGRGNLASDKETVVDGGQRVTK